MAFINLRLVLILLFGKHMVLDQLIGWNLLQHLGQIGHPAALFLAASAPSLMQFINFSHILRWLTSPTFPLAAFLAKYVDIY